MNRLFLLTCLACLCALLEPPAALGDWHWNAASGDPGLTVGGNIPPCSAGYDAGPPAFVMDYPQAQSGYNKVWARKTVGSYSGDFSVSASFRYVSAGYDFCVTLASANFDPMNPSGPGQAINAGLHNGHQDNFWGSSKTDAGAQTYFVWRTPRAPNDYRFEFGRTGASMYSKFWLLDGTPQLLGNLSWTTYDPTAPLTNLYLIGTADMYHGSGEVWVNEIHVTPEPASFLLLALGGLLVGGRRRS